MARGACPVGGIQKKYDFNSKAKTKCAVRHLQANLSQNIQHLDFITIVTVACVEVILHVC